MDVDEQQRVAVSELAREKHLGVTLELTESYAWMACSSTCCVLVRLPANGTLAGLTSPLYEEVFVPRYPRLAFPVIRRHRRSLMIFAALQ